MNTPRRIVNDWITSCRSMPIASRRRLVMGGALLLSVNCLLLILTYAPFLTWFAFQFRVEDTPVESDAIVFLLGSYDRSSRAADLYRQGLAPLVLMGPTDGAWGEAEGHRRILMDKGVPADAIEVLPGEIVRSTHDEALRVREYVRSHPVRRITVVTSAGHTARARWTFCRVLNDSGVEVRMAASDRQFTEADWFRYDDGIRLYLSEVLKTLYYRVAY